MDSKHSQVKIYPDLAYLSREAAELFVSRAARAVDEKGRFVAALAGGGTPQNLYQLLASPEFSERIPWHSVHLFWGDERCVPPDHEDSNYGMAEKALISNVPLPSVNIHRMKGELGSRHGAGDYEKELRDLFPGVPLPVFDLILLGLGTDGHTASLFPGSDGLTARDRLVVHDSSPALSHPRITLTLPVINQASTILFLVAGKEKAEVLAQALEDQGADPLALLLPAQMIFPVNGELYWYVDEAAASRL
jgi:6-phosphogluconolactonase